MIPLIACARTMRDSFFGVRPLRCPAHLRTNHRALKEGGEESLHQSLRAHYFSYGEYFPDPVDVYFSTAAGRADLKAHLTGRLDTMRQTLIPWIDDTVHLAGARVLEIGCGTGSSTLALAEQGAHVYATDVHHGSIQVARDRLGLYGVEAALSCSNARDTFQQLGSAAFDVVAFVGVLEHMTLDERLASLIGAWTTLRSGGYLVVQETPNRLWYRDDHTSYEHFFLWLPDDVAMRYSTRTPRERYNRLFNRMSCESASIRLNFARWGRGVSYHDFVLALDVPASELPVVSCLQLYVREKTRIGSIPRWLSRQPMSRRYEEMLVSMRPELHRGFYLRYLDLILRKP